MNFIDIIVLVVIGLSALVAFANGFVNVVLWILSWVGAVFATIYFYPMARPIAERYISEPLIANIATAAAIFIVALIICAILNQIISRAVRGSAIGALDRTLGLILGVVIGGAMVCCAYLLMIKVIPDERDRPQSVAEAKTLPMVQKGAEFLSTMVPEGWIEKGEAFIEQGSGTLDKGKSVNETIQNLTPTVPAEPGAEPGENGATPAVPEAPAGTTGGGTGQTQGSNANPPGNPDGQAAASGYKDAQRNDLDRLIESSQ